MDPNALLFFGSWAGGWLTLILVAGIQVWFAGQRQKPRG